MKKLILFFALASQTAFAADTLKCTSEDGQIKLDIAIQYSPRGKFSAATKFNGVELKSIDSKAFKILEGWTTGDMDNYSRYLLTILSSEKGQEALFVVNDHVDRVGFQNTVHRLQCK